MRPFGQKLIYAAALAFCFMIFSFWHLPSALSHCDTIDGPVIATAKNALKTSNVNLVLPWVPKADEQGVRDAFRQAVEVRKLGPEAQQFADQYFFETLVRLHRAGEGVPYTGLKPVPREADAAVMKGDEALKTGSPAAVEQFLIDAVQDGVKRHFRQLRDAALYDSNDIDAARRYVQQYVQWIHYIENVHSAASRDEAVSSHEDSEQLHQENH